MCGSYPEGMWTLLAGAMVAFHLAYLLYVILGGLLALRSARWVAPHVACVAWGVVVVVMQWKCPLTSIEKGLWVRAGETPYTGSFLDHYIFGTYLPDGSQTLVYSLQLGFVMVVYALIGRQHMVSARRHSDVGL